MQLPNFLQWFYPSNFTFQSYFQDVKVSTKHTSWLSRSSMGCNWWMKLKICSVRMQFSGRSFTAQFCTLNHIVVNFCCSVSSSPIISLNRSFVRKGLMENKLQSLSFNVWEVWKLKDILDFNLFSDKSWWLTSALLVDQNLEVKNRLEAFIFWEHVGFIRHSHPNADVLRLLRLV